MAGKETIVFCVHGANQADKDEQQNHKTWSDSFELEDDCVKVRNVISGLENDEIQAYHLEKHSGCDFPQYVGWDAAWYGNIWQRLQRIPENERFSKKLSSSLDGEVDERLLLVEKIERKAMQKHFDELVPFYELSVCADSGKTMYEEICAKILADLWAATDSGTKDFIILGHSMGCNTGYNLLSHMTRVAEGKAPAAIPGALSEQYQQAVKNFVDAPGKPFALLTFGNYMGYNWAQKANTRILYGERSRHYVFPDYCPRWLNFYTILGGDPYIIDDLLENSIVSDEADGYDDVRVWRVPFSNIGHGRHSWFSRDSFTKRLRKKLKKHLYR